ncbi:hypothetical protein B9Z65_3939 [Elsinoe australis]|uniref:CENP-V/GFA domain-containing protein n=1 Tax=Elsinoe australis TaxID=40998 RepID=A0A2P7Z1D8_9PEZI|nr:hypothetical protein B9Z65_3939 [Elsinoe australis]
MRTGGQPTGSSAATKNEDESINADQQPTETSNEPSKDTQTDQNTPIRTYRGNCHCKAFVYQVQLPELTSAVECNCSICYKKGYLRAFVDTRKIEIVKGSDASLSRYSFGSQRLEHKFCPTCATPLMAEQVQHGTTALNNGYLWTYPEDKQVVLYASDPATLGRYSFSRHVLNKTFCKICGVCMTNEYAHRTEQERKALGAIPARGFAQSMKTEHPLNLRVFPSVDLSRLRPTRLLKGAENISPQYVHP